MEERSKRRRTPLRSPPSLRSSVCEPFSPQSPELHAYKFARSMSRRFPNLWRGLSVSAVDALSLKVAALKKQHRSGPLANRIADVEVYLDAVRRPLKYDERLYAPDGRHAGRPRAADARHRQRARGSTRRRRDAVDDAERRARLLLPDRRLGAALHPDMPDGLRRGGAAPVPARRLHARPRRHRARAAVHGEVDDRLRVEAARRRAPTGSCCSPTAATPTPAGLPARSTVSKPSSRSEGLSDRSRTASS